MTEAAGGTKKDAEPRTKKVTVFDLASKKRRGEPISVVTSYDYTLASLCDRSGVDILLVGDSAGMVMLGYDSTIPVTMKEMCMFTAAVGRARRGAMIVSDLPFMSYQASEADAVRNAGRLVRAGADAVKLEGAGGMAARIKAIVDAGIPVMGHIGLQPQTATLTHGYKVQGATADGAENLLDAAAELEEAGAFAIVLEMVASEAAGLITEALGIPTIGIGSGPECDGQVLVVHDMLGMYDDIRPRFARQYAGLAGEITDSVSRYVGDVSAKRFPAAGELFRMREGQYEELRRRRRAR